MYKRQCKNIAYHFPYTIHLFPVTCIILSYIHRIIRFLHLRGGERGRSTGDGPSSSVSVPSKGRCRHLPPSLCIQCCPLRTLPRVGRSATGSGTLTVASASTNSSLLRFEVPRIVLIPVLIALSSSASLLPWRDPDVVTPPSCQHLRRHHWLDRPSLHFPRSS